MTINRRKKCSRQRNTRTCGWGTHKKHRGHGNRGGAGAAGSGKRADAKKPSIWASVYFGKHGFHSKKQGSTNAINVGELELALPKLLESKQIKKEKDSYVIELEKLGFDKLLGSGIVKSKMAVSVNQATEKAIDKITKSNGEVKVKISGAHAKGNTAEPA